jgi:hypothetical protein
MLYPPSKQVHRTRRPARKRQSEQPSTSNQSPLATISSFIEDNYKQLSVLAILTALTVFASNLPIKSLGSILSFLLLTLSILVWIEIIGRFPKALYSWRLTYFLGTLFLVPFILAAYLIIEYYPLWSQYYFWILLLIVGFPIFLTPRLLYDALWGMPVALHQDQMLFISRARLVGGTFLAVYAMLSLLLLKPILSSIITQISSWIH